MLTLRLTRAPEDLAYDAKSDMFRPIRASEQAEVTKAQLYYQAETGGRKAGGVFYTRHEFVAHLLNHSLLPALDGHLAEVKKVAQRDTTEATRRLFDFSVVDPAMGSAHFLTAALDMMADRIEIFLAEVGGLPGIAQLLKELSQDNGAFSQRPEDGSSAPAGSGGGWTRTVPPPPRGGSSTWEPSLGEMRAPGWRYEPLPSQRWTG